MESKTVAANQLNQKNIIRSEKACTQRIEQKTGEHRSLINVHNVSLPVSSAVQNCQVEAVT